LVDDNTLIFKLKNPKLKEEGFKELLDLYQERLYWHIRKIVITHDNTNDVLQNTFIRIFKSIDSFKGKSSLHTWMYRIAYNESLRFIQQNKRYTINSTSDNTTLDYFTLISEDPYINANDIQKKLHKIILSLPEKQRHIFQLKYFDDLSFRQISEIIKKNENTIKSSYYSAVKTIEKEIITL